MCVFLFGSVGGVRKEMWRPTGLLCRVAEESLGCAVPTLDNAVQILADNGIVGRIDNCRQPRAGQFPSSAIGNIDDDVDGPKSSPPLVDQGVGVS